MASSRSASSRSSFSASIRSASRRSRLACSSPSASSRSTGCCLARAAARPVATWPAAARPAAVRSGAASRSASSRLAPAARPAAARFAAANRPGAARPAAATWPAAGRAAAAATGQPPSPPPTALQVAPLAMHPLMPEAAAHQPFGKFPDSPWGLWTRRVSRDPFSGLVIHSVKYVSGFPAGSPDSPGVDSLPGSRDLPAVQVGSDYLLDRCDLEGRRLRACPAPRRRLANLAGPWCVAWPTTLTATGRASWSRERAENVCMISNIVIVILPPSAPRPFASPLLVSSSSSSSGRLGG